MTDWRQFSIQRVITASYGGQALLIPLFPYYCDSCLLHREAFRSRFPASLPISIIQTKHHREKCIKAIKYHKGLLQTPGGTNKKTAVMKRVLWLSPRPFVNIPVINNARAPACFSLLQRPQGLLCLLDEESQSLRPAEQTLYKRLSAQLDSSSAPGLSLTTKDGNGNPPPKDQGPAFTVSHYAGQVRLCLSEYRVTAELGTWTVTEAMSSNASFFQGFFLSAEK